MNSTEELITIATIGKAIGLKGDLKLHLYTDFTDQFRQDTTFLTDNQKYLKIQSYNHKRGAVNFYGFNSKEEASKLINHKLYTTKEESYKRCRLDKNEYFWFDILGCEVFENGIKLGKVKDIQRVGINDLIEISTDKLLVKDGKAKSFLIPYINDTYIKEVSLDTKSIEVSNALDLLDIL
jgi:16S rRNA processing protein RimM